MIRREQVRERLRLNAPLAEAVLTSFIRDAVETSGTQGVVVGLSGGVDSSLSAALAARALGPERVHGFLLPYRTSSAESERAARVLAEHLGVLHRAIDISPMVDAYFRIEPDAGPDRRGNKMARERMTILFDQAKRLNALVLGTSNKTEILLGYSTVFGDNASSLNPLGDLYKHQVWQLSRHLGLPEQVVRVRVGVLRDLQRDALVDGAVGEPVHLLARGLQLRQVGQRMPDRGDQWGV